jgi:hypothetical protein
VEVGALSNSKVRALALPAMTCRVPWFATSISIVDMSSIAATKTNKPLSVESKETTLTVSIRYRGLNNLLFHLWNSLSSQPKKPPVFLPCSGSNPIAILSASRIADFRSIIFMGCASGF